MASKRRWAAPKDEAWKVVCHLPPHKHPIPFASNAAYEAHYLEQHAFRCMAPLPQPCTAATTLAACRRAEESTPRCGKSFPSAHFLTLHVDECHSALTAQRKARGEKTYGCFEPLCTRQFLTPKLRRLHLIDAHYYPPQFFFGITVHGTGRLRDLYGPSASLVRKPWRSGNEQGIEDGEGDEPEQVENGSPMDSRSVERVEDDAQPCGQSHDAAKQGLSAGKKRERDGDDAPVSPSTLASGADHGNLDIVLEQMSSLTLVPRVVQSKGL